jgi:hypothetical protein
VGGLVVMNKEVTFFFFWLHFVFLHILQKIFSVFFCVAATAVVDGGAGLIFLFIKSQLSGL